MNEGHLRQCVNCVIFYGRSVIIASPLLTTFVLVDESEEVAIDEDVRS